MFLFLVTKQGFAKVSIPEIPTLENWISKTGALLIMEKHSHYLKVARPLAGREDACVNIQFSFMSYVSSNLDEYKLEHYHSFSILLM